MSALSPLERNVLDWLAAQGAQIQALLAELVNIDSGPSIRFLLRLAFLLGSAFTLFLSASIRLMNIGGGRSPMRTGLRSYIPC